jgi:hypothetical protein
MIGLAKIWPSGPGSLLYGLPVQKTVLDLNQFTTVTLKNDSTV